MNFEYDKYENKEYISVLVKQILITIKISIIVRYTVKKNKSSKRSILNWFKVIIVKNYPTLQFNRAHKINLKYNIIQNLKNNLKNNLKKNVKNNSLKEN